jgi:hypothetical protein
MGATMREDPSAARFPTTDWSRVVAASDRVTALDRAALAELRLACDGSHFARQSTSRMMCRIDFAASLFHPSGQNPFCA